MSKVGKVPIALKDGVNVSVQGSVAEVSGPKGNASVNVPNGINVEIKEGQVVVTAADPNDKKIRAFFGMFRANLANAVTGVDQGFEKKLEMTGVGYRAVMQGAELVLSVGYSHPVKFTAKDGIKLSVADNVISVAGIDKALVGELAAEIRAVRPPEPYKGKGIRYQGEYVRRKAGKAAKAAGATK